MRVARPAERAAQVADHVVPLAADDVDGVVDPLEIPTVQERHHHAQAVQLLRADEGILEPVPVADLRVGGPLPLQPRATDDPAGRHELAAALQVRQTRHRHGVQVIDFVDQIAGRPEESRGRGFRLRLVTELDLPHDTPGVGDVELRAGRGVSLARKREFPRGRRRMRLRPAPWIRSRVATGPGSSQRVSTVEVHPASAAPRRSAASPRRAKHNRKLVRAITG